MSGSWVRPPVVRWDGLWDRLDPRLGFYGSGRSIYSNVVARGQEVTFPMNTAIEIRFGSGPPQHPPK